jgi:hypothetical protein
MLHSVVCRRLSVLYSCFAGRGSEAVTEPALQKLDELKVRVLGDINEINFGAGRLL